MPIKHFRGTDPFEFAKQLARLALVRRVTFGDATFTLGTIPANSVILDRRITRTTPWDAITTFHVGKAGDTDWLVDTTEANVIGALDAGESGNTEVITGDRVVTVDTPIVVTLNQGAATAGVGYVIVEYAELVR